MIRFNNGGVLIEHAGELPPLPDSIENMYADFETGSGSPTEKSLNPYHNCAPCGFAVTWDDNPTAYYIPVRGNNAWQHWGESWPAVGRGAAYTWLRDVIRRSKRWCNHHVKYDAHVYCLHCGQFSDLPELVCTIVGAKLIDSNRGWGHNTYALDSVSADWIGENINRYEERLQPYLYRNKDYSHIPPDIIGEYACQDVLSNRLVHRYEQQNMPTESEGVWATERKLTTILLEMEIEGLRIISNDLAYEECKTFVEMMTIEKQLEQLVGRSFRPHVNEDCYEVLCGQFGLPVMGWTDPSDSSPNGNPSFDKAAMTLYRSYPGSPKAIIEGIVSYRKLNTLRNFFIIPYQRLHIDGQLHSSFNQCVRTGRLSCKDPNAMQLSKRAKELVHPPTDHSFLSNDAMGVEFRLIAHYIQDPAVLKTFAENPDADFHQLIADMLGIKRGAAKTLNFAIGYGAGKKKTCTALSLNEDVTGNIEKLVDERIAAGDLEQQHRKTVIDQMCRERGESFYRQYHEMLPGIKTTSRKAAEICNRRGYVKNLAGRRRYLTTDFAHTSFNSLCQSTAADIVKDRMVALHEAYRGTPLKIVCQVHDEILTTGPTDVINDPRTQRDVLSILEHNTFGVRVPIRWSTGVGSRHWREASDDKGCPEGVRTVDRSLPFSNFAHLR